MDRANRKSRAPWQMRAPRNRSHSNPYADAASIAPDDHLAVPKTAASKSRKQSRRLSIHASAAAAHNMMFEANALPALPDMQRTATNNLDMVLVRSHREERLVLTIRSELRDKDATAIDDFHKLLLGQQLRLDAEIKDKINQNQKNILQLTANLQVTQEELVLLRVHTKELYLVLAEFTDAAERRLELENQDPDRLRSASLKVAPKKRDRSSVMVLQKMWASELQLLYKHVDGAQKFVQPIPGRHILAESGRWHEINVGTWKPTKPIHLFLLNDAVLVATRKPAQENSSQKLMAVYCWPFHTVDISQVKPPASAGSADTQLYVINVRANSLSYVYQTDRYDHFMRVINAYNKGRAELLQRDRMFEEESSKPHRASQDIGHHRNPSSNSLAEDQDKWQLRDSLRNSGYADSPSPSTEDLTYKRRSGSNRQSADILLKDISARVHSRNRSHDFKKQERMGRDANNPAQLFTELKTNEDKLDEVDVQLAHNEYMGVVGLIKHIEGRLASVVERIPTVKNDEGQAEELRLLVDVVKLKINNRKLKVQRGLAFDLHHSIASLTTDDIGKIIEFYMSFDKLEEGLAALREALSSHLASTVGKLISNAHGSTRVDIVNYLSNLTIVHVLIIRRAVNIHKNCVEPILKRGEHKEVDSSGFVTWCISEVQLLVESIKKHASGSLLVEDDGIWVAKDPKYYEELIKVVWPQLLLLKKEGLKVDYLFADILHCRPLTASG